MIDIALPETPPATDEQLRNALASALAERIPGRWIRTLRRRMAAYGSSFHLEEVDVELDDGQTIQLMFKDLGRLVGSARGVKPVFLHDPEREILVYRDLLRPAQFGTPICYGALVSHIEHRYWLFIERITGVPLRESGDFGLWTRAAAWLARFHTEFAPRVASLKRHNRLLAMDRDLFGTWMPRALETVSDPGMRQSLARVAARYEGVVDRLAALPPTLIHGEFYPSNILVREPGGGLAPIDWETAAIGPGSIDLAALVTGWPHEEGLALARAYYDAAGEWLALTSFGSLLEALDCCRLHLALQWLGWSAVWSAPPEHRHDWFHTAMVLAQRVVPEGT